MSQAVCPACGGTFVVPPPKRPLECPHCAIPLARGAVSRSGAGPHRTTESVQVAVAGLSPTSRIRIDRGAGFTVLVDGIMVAGLEPDGDVFWFGARRAEVRRIARIDVDPVRGLVVINPEGRAFNIPATADLPPRAQRWLAYQIQQALRR